MEESMTEQAIQKHFLTKVEAVDGAMAIDVPQEIFKRLHLQDGATLLWTFNDDGTVTLGAVHWS
jgi:hypothetical protein